MRAQATRSSRTTRRIDLADLDPRARGRHDASRDQPLGRRRNVEITRSWCSTTSSQGIAFDKNWVACDNTPSSPFYGRCYLVYTHSADRDMLAVSLSDDSGLTWSAPVDIGARPAVGVFPAIRPTGELVVVYLWEAGQFAIAASRSTDGGATWACACSHRLGRRRLCSIRGFRAFPLPSAEVDATGRVWTTWHDCESRGTSTNNAVFVATSPDGAQWSAPRGGDARSQRRAPRNRHRRGDREGRNRLLRSRTAGIDVELVESPGDPASWAGPRRLSARSMPLAVDAGHDVGPHVRATTSRCTSRAAVRSSSGCSRPEPVGRSFRQAVYATRS